MKTTMQEMDMQSPAQDNRRDFLKKSFLATAMVGLGPSAYAFLGDKKVLETVLFSERLTPISILWDVSNLILKDKNKTWKMMDSLSEGFNKMLCGSALRGHRQHLPSLLTTIKEGGGWDGEIHPQVALFAGFLAYGEVEKVFATIPKTDGIGTGALYRDCTILKYRVEREGQGSSTDKPTKDEIEDFLKLMYHRATFRTHTLTPDAEDWERWLVDYIDGYHRDRDYLKGLAEVYLEARPAYHKNYADTRFFDPEDEIIKMANDYSLREIDLTPSFVQDKGKSLYAKALTNAVIAVKSLDDYFDGRMNRSAFVEKYDIA
jgi:hypothetical protein